MKISKLSNQNSQVLNSKRFHERDVFLVKTLGISLCSYKLTGLAGVRAASSDFRKVPYDFQCVLFSAYDGECPSNFFPLERPFWAKLYCIIFISLSEKQCPDVRSTSFAHFLCIPVLDHRQTIQCIVNKSVLAFSMTVSNNLSYLCHVRYSQISTASYSF